MSKKKSKGLGGVITFSAVSFFVVAFLITLTILANGMLKPILQTILGGQKPVLEDSYEKIYTSDYKSKADAVAAGNKLNVKIEEEGAVLLLNEDNALPIAKGSKVSVFGKNSVQLVLGGSGSGGGSSEGASTIFDGLKEGGFEYNPTLKEFYESSASGSGRSDSPALTEGSSSAPTLKTGETPVSAYTNEVKNSFAKYHDAALVVISRLGGESWDLPRTQSDDESRHYLQLDANEYAMLDMVTSRFDKVVVILNVLTSFQCDFIDEYNNTAENKRIDAVLWIGGPGKTGALALGSILNGDVSPSGRTTAIYSRDFRKDPTWQNFGDGTQTTADGSENASLLQVGSPSGYYMVAYEEGVYLGYRYYETRDYVEFEKDAASTWYEDNVVFPFGYGLSYSQFNQSITALTGDLSSGKITVTVKVDWTGGKPGKDVVQLYVSKPYYENGIEKPYVQLVDYAKTETLSADNGSQTFTFTVSAYDLACYDYNDANKDMRTGYVTEHGDYTFFVSKDSHVRENAYDQKTTTLGDDMFFATDPVTGTTVENRYTTNDYDDIQYRLGSVYVGSDIRKGMSRTDFEGTFPKAPTKEERVLSTEEYNGFDELSKLQSKAHNNTKVEGVTQMPEIGNPSSSDIVLHDLLGADGKVAYDNERWADVLKKITYKEMLELVNNGAFQTAAIESIGKNLTNDSDGPMGFVNFLGGAVTEIFADNTNFACESVIGATWNKNLAYEMGLIIGECGVWGDQSGNNFLPYTCWYAPAVNLHRSPFSGRNFEYYSEDPIVSGKMAVNVITGAREKGVAPDLKHFALNDQETNRQGVSTYCTEQALRELYLKPFELAVKADEDVALVKSAADRGLTEFRPATGVMSSFNRIGNKWTGGDYRLLTEILREEWGFKGLVICDYKTDNFFMDSRQMLYAGNDLILTSTGNTQWTDASESSAQDVYILQQSTKNILYTVANSNSIQIKIIGYNTEWWITLITVLDIVVPIGLAVWGFFAIRKFIKRSAKAKAEETEAPDKTTEAAE